MISRCYRKILFFTLLVALFVSQGCGEFSSSTPLMTEVVATETITPVATKTIQSISTQIPVQVIEPLITSLRLRFDSWSPDSQWFAYWFADGDEVPAHLAFVDVQSGEICQHDEIRAVGIESGGVKWLGNGKVNAIDYSGKKALSGAPCDVFTEVEFIPPSNEQSLLSPDGRYRAETFTREWEEQLMRNTTTITEIATGRVVADVEWNGSPHLLSDHGWLNSELFLIGMTVEEGVKYISVSDGQVRNVMTDLLKLDYRDLSSVMQIRFNNDQSKDQYHLLVERWEYPSELPLLLYHSETDIVERLPFYRAWTYNGSSFSPDGKWVFISPLLKPDVDIELWLYPVESADRSAIKIADISGFGGFSAESNMIALFNDNLLDVYNFPTGKFLSRWGASGYYIDRLWWSPDGLRLVMQGFPIGSKPDAIFVIEP